ncbi:hypothetical protein FQN57_001919 [Myotisia sp. PD_48]|nr:hypothetical protein FQN57_001919 [Myotisia sp. PD_48]
MSDHKAELVQSTNDVPKRGFFARTGAHLKRFWWAYLAGLIVVVLVVVLPIIYVAYPKAAQKSVNESTLDITELQITEPAPESLHLKIRQVIGSHSKYHPVLDAFNATVTLYGETEPFTFLNAPQVKAEDGAESMVDQPVHLDNIPAFTNYAKAVMHNEEIKLIVAGETGLKQGSLPKTTVTYNKTVTMKGMNGLKGFDVTAFNPLSMAGQVYIPNPSVMTLTLGNITLDLSIDDVPVGQSFLNNVVLKPGNNTMAMQSRVNQTYVLGLIMGENAKYPDGTVPVTIVGNSSVYNGQELKYYSDALASNKLLVQLNLSGRS